MKKLIAAGICFIAFNAGATNVAGVIPVLDDQKTDTVYSIDLDSVKKSKNQVLGGVTGENYINALFKIEAYPNNALRQSQGVHIIGEEWVISCQDYSYYKLSRSVYGDNYNFLSSERLGNDIPVKSQFITTDGDEASTIAIRNATLAACKKFDTQNATPWSIKKAIKMKAKHGAWRFKNSLNKR